MNRLHQVRALARFLRFFRLAPLAGAVLLAACAGSHDETSAQTASRDAASGTLPKGDPVAGERAANTRSRATNQSCLDCHGADGNQPLDASYPRIGGQYRDYLAHALTQYRSGAREHVLMSQQAGELSDQQIADLAVYFSSRPSLLRDLKGAY